jgi:hypothetical protein
MLYIFHFFRGIREHYKQNLNIKIGILIIKHGLLGNRQDTYFTKKKQSQVNIRIVEFLFSSSELNVHESHFAPIVIVVCALAIHISVFFPMKSLQQTEPYAW